MSIWPERNFRYAVSHCVTKNHKNAPHKSIFSILLHFESYNFTTTSETSRVIISINNSTRLSGNWFMCAAGLAKGSLPLCLYLYVVCFVFKKSPEAPSSFRNPSFLFSAMALTNQSHTIWLPQTCMGIGNDMNTFCKIYHLSKEDKLKSAAVINCI